MASITEWFTDSLDSVGEIAGATVDNIGGIYTKLDAFMSNQAQNTTVRPTTVERGGVQVPVQEAGNYRAVGGMSANTILVAVGSLGGLLLTLKVFKVI